MKTVLITGASGGLGQEIARACDRREYRLILCSRRSIDYRFVSKPETMIGDLRDESYLDSLQEKARTWSVSALINCAGVYSRSPFTEFPRERIREILEVNLLAPIILTQRLWPTLVKHRGTVVNIGSLAGRYGSDGESIYCASKFGLRGFSAALQFDGTRDGVDVIDFSLGGIRTNMISTDDKRMDPAEVAQVVVSMLNPGATYRVTELTMARKVYQCSASAE